MTKILITGGTGKVGSRVIEQLAGRTGVRALAHSDASAARLVAQGVEVVHGDTGDAAALAGALEGIERLFLLTPYTPAQGAEEQALIAAASEAGVQHVVKLSSLLDGWDLPIMAGHAASTAALRESGLGWSVLQPDNFMDNELAALDAVRAGVVVAPTGAARLSFVDARDIAGVAVHELTADDPRGGDLVITGPEALTYAEYATRLGAGLDVELQHVSPPPDAYAATLREHGVPGFYADDLTAMFVAIGEHGLTHEPTSVVAELSGRPPRDATTFAREVLAPALAG